MLIAGLVVGSIACVLMGGLCALLWTTVNRPDTRLAELTAKQNAMALELENTYDQLLRWNKKADKRKADEAIEPVPPAASDASRRDTLRRFISTQARSRAS